MKLKGGESVPMEIGLPPEIAEAIARGACLTVDHGPVMETSPNHFERMIDLCLDGQPFGSMMISWEGCPVSWYQRAWNWILRRPPLTPPDIRIGPPGRIE